MFIRDSTHYQPALVSNLTTIKCLRRQIGLPADLSTVSPSCYPSLVVVQTESMYQICRPESTCKHCSQAICYNEPNMMEKLGCSEDTNQTIDTYTSPHGLINVDRTCSFNLNTLNTSWIQIGVFNRTLFNLTEINDRKEKSNGSCSYNFQNKETMENIGTLTVTRSLSAGDCDFYQLGYLVIEQPSDLLSISYEAEQNMSSTPFQLIYRGKVMCTHCYI